MQRSDNEIASSRRDFNNDNNNNDDPNFDRKFDQITQGAPIYLKEHLKTRITAENLKIIIEYIQAFQKLGLLSDIVLILFTSSSS
jgi:hypothetical protein